MPVPKLIKVREMKKIIFSFIILLVAALLFSVSCATTRKESRLDPESEEFFSHTRYIITKEESKIFVELPPSARNGFIEDFWVRRDPTPETERNEYRDAYFLRIEEANKLFRGPRPGWLQDRGRIFVLFGPPNERQTNPMGQRPIDAYDDARELTGGQRIATGEKATEVWIYYDLFSSLQQPHMVRLIFVDSHGTGDYTLTTDLDEVIPGGLNMMIAPDLRIIHELHKEEQERARLRVRRSLFDFSWELFKEKNKDLGSNLSISLSLPYKKVIFVDEQGRLRAELDLRIQVWDASEKTIWEKRSGDVLDFRPEYLEQNKEGAWEVKIPVLAWLEKGTYSIYIRLENRSGDQVIEKLLPLKM